MAAPPHAGDTIIDVTFSGGSADRPVISQLPATYGLDISILGAAIDTDRRQPGRSHPPRTARVAQANAPGQQFLRARGLLVEIVGGAA